LAEKQSKIVDLGEATLGKERFGLGEDKLEYEEDRLGNSEGD